MEDLLIRYIAQECTAEEQRQVEAWLEESPENRAQYHKLKLANELAAPDRQPRFDADSAWATLRQHTVDHAHEDPREAIKQRKLPVWRIVLRVAAVVFLVGIVLFALLGEVRKTTSSEDFLADAPKTYTYHSNNKPGHIVLYDSTRVTLDRGAVLTYTDKPVDGVRKVELQGRAYFDVSENEELPFMVLAGLAEVRVLGTQFLVDSRQEEEVTVAVEQGSVEVTRANTVATPVAPEKAVLTAGQQAEVSTHQPKVKVEEAKVVNHRAFETGVLEYEKVPLRLVAAEIEDMYGVEVHLPAEAQDCLLTATFNRSTLTAVLDMISLTFGLEADRDGQTITFSGQGC